MNEHDPESHEPQPPPLPARETLNYRSAPQKQLYMPMVAQIAIGFAAWVAMVVLFIFIGAAASGAMTQDSDIFALIALGVIAVIIMCALVRGKLGWRGFIPGVLLGFGVTCLLPLGLAVILCGQWN
jgi:hypothetical protein